MSNARKTSLALPGLRRISSRSSMTTLGVARGSRSGERAETTTSCRSSERAWTSAKSTTTDLFSTTRTPGWTAFR
jgi:hypothetical protein